MATAPGVNNTPLESATTQASDPPPPEGQSHAMEVDDEGTHPRLASPVSICGRRFADGQWCNWGGVGLGPPHGFVSKEPKWSG